MAKKPILPYIMRGPPQPTQRPTIADPPDRRVDMPRTEPLTPQQLRAMSQEETDPRLRSVHRILRRWAVTRGGVSDAPRLARGELLVRTSSDRASPLDDAESSLVDKILRTSPDWATKFVRAWYRYNLDAEEMQSLFKIKRRAAVYEERKLVLAYFLGRLSQAGMTLPSWEGVE